VYVYLAIYCALYPVCMCVDMCGAGGWSQSPHSRTPACSDIYVRYAAYGTCRERRLLRRGDQVGEERQRMARAVGRQNDAMQDGTAGGQAGTCELIR
jgi:hypothetical protein